MNSYALQLFTDSSLISTLGRFDPPSERTRFKTCEAHGQFSVEVSECPRCRLARTLSAERAAVKRVLLMPRRCGCGCGADLPPAKGPSDERRKYLNPTHAKRQFNRGLRSAEKRLRGRA